jgi:hypothetical protein
VIDDVFVKPTSNLESLHAQITDALRELRGARAIQVHSPGAEADRDVDLAEWRLDVLLLRQTATTKAQAEAEKLVTQ